MARLSTISLLVSCLAIITVGCAGGYQTSTYMPTSTQTLAHTLNRTNTVSVTFAPPMPVAVAEKIGKGSWMAVSLPGDGTLAVTLPAGTKQYAVAFLCTWTRSGTPVSVEWVIEADLKDGASYTLQQCPVSTPSTQPPGAITGSFDASAISTTQHVTVAVYGDSVGVENSGTSESFNFTAPIGTTDLYAAAYDSSANLVGIKIVRSQTIPGAANGGNPISLTASDAVTALPVSITNLPAGFNPPISSPGPTYFSAQGSFPVGFGGFPAATMYGVVPAAEAQPGDYYFFNASSGTANQQVSTQQYMTTASPVTLNFPGPWAPQAPAPAIFPTFTFDYTGFSGQAAIADNAGISWSQSPTFFGIGLIATANFQKGATTVTLPDLTSVPGFFPMAPAGTTVTWVATTWGGTVQFFAGPLAIPQTVSNVSGQGTYTQP